jgi:Asp-tRNA(Asn)/Glu-tRNA(Gln) amidotransferase C subunit
MIYNSETNSVNLSESDESAVEKLAQKIIKSEGNANFDDDLEEIIKLVQSVSKLDATSAIGLYRSKGSRYHQRAGSPVKSNRFF